MNVAAAARALVIVSTLAAIVVGLWPLASQPWTFASLVILLGASAAAARRHWKATATIVLACAYLSYGGVRLVAGAQVAAMPFWLAAFTGLAIGGAQLRRSAALRSPWRLLLAWWGATVAVCWPFAAASALDGGLPAIGTTSPVASAALLQMSLSLWMDRLIGEAVEDPDRAAVAHAGLGRALWLSAIVTAAAAAGQRWVAPAWLSGEPWISLHRSVGLMGDANPLGFVTATWAPLTAVFFTRRGPMALLTAAGAILLWIAAWYSGARSALILFAAGAMGLAATGVTRRAWPWYLPLGLAAVMVAAVVIAGSRLGPETPVQRLVRTLPIASLGDVSYEVLWRRDGYGLAAVQAIREHPLMGVGIGRFTPLSTAYHQRVAGRAIPPDNAQNLWRHHLAEQGIVGFVPLVLMTILTLRDIWSGRGVPIALRVMLVGIGGVLLVGYPLQDPAAAVTVATLVAIQARSAAAPGRPSPAGLR